MNNKLYVGGLPYSVTDGQLQEIFSTHGWPKFWLIKVPIACKQICALTPTYLRLRVAVIFFNGPVTSLWLHQLRRLL